MARSHGQKTLTLNIWVMPQKVTHEKGATEQIHMVDRCVCDELDCLQLIAPGMTITLAQGHCAIVQNGSNAAAVDKCLALAQVAVTFTLPCLQD